MDAGHRADVEMHDLLPPEVRRVLRHADDLWSSTQMWEFWQEAAPQGITAQQFADQLQAHVKSTMRP